MKKIFIALVFILLCFSCKQNGTSSETDVEKTPEELVKDGVAAIDLLKVGEPYELCEQKITSEESVNAAKDNSSDGYEKESTPASYAFFFPEPDIEPSELVSKVQVRYNCFAVGNRVLHAFELFERIEPDDKDIRSTVKSTQPELTSSFLAEAIPDAKMQKSAASLLNAYKNFDGNGDEDSALANAFNSFNMSLSDIPEICTTEMLDSLKDNFWAWYDKAQFVPEIDNIIRINLPDVPAVKVPDETLAHMKAAVLSEKDIDRRAILALELAKFDDSANAALGEILESGIYTRYLLEVWLAWRSHIQMSCFGPSSFCTIPNNYYDRMRVKCLNTLLRHYQQTKDTKDLCFVENFIEAEIVHRQGALSGNDCVLTLEALSSGMFIHPRISGNDYLESEDN